MASTPNFSVPHLLIVQHDPPLALAARSAVNDLAWTSTQFSDGGELLAWLDSRLEPLPLKTLILSDLRLPRVSGLRMMQELRQRGIHIPAVIVTAWVDDGICELLRLYGARYVLFKPVEPATLKDVLLTTARVSDLVSTAPSRRKAGVAEEH